MRSSEVYMYLPPATRDGFGARSVPLFIDSRLRRVSGVQRTLHRRRHFKLDKEAAREKLASIIWKLGHAKLGLRCVRDQSDGATSHAHLNS